MKAIWLACCACGDYGLLQREVEGRDAGAQVLRVGDLGGLVSMARAFPSRRGAAIIAASLFDIEDVHKTVARLTAEGRVSRVVVLIEALDPSDIEGLFRAGATEVIAAHSICGNGRAGEGAVDSDRRMTIEPDAFVDREPGAPRATRGPRVDDYGKAEAEHGRRPRNPLVYDDAGGPAQHAGDSPAVDMGYVHGVNLADELDEVEGFAGCGELSLMQHEQIAQNEPALQTEQAVMPAWTQRVVAAGEDGDAVADARPAASDAAGRRCHSAASSSGHLRHFGFGRVRQVDDRCHHGTHIVAVGLACRRARPGLDVWKPLRLVRRRCSARYGGTYRAVGGGRAHRAGYRSHIDARGAGRYALGSRRGARASRAHGTSGGAAA